MDKDMHLSQPKSRHLTPTLRGHVGMITLSRNCRSLLKLIMRISLSVGAVEDIPLGWNFEMPVFEYHSPVPDLSNMAVAEQVGGLHQGKWSRR